MPSCSATTAKGEPCKKAAMRGHELCAFHLQRVGRASLLEPDVIDRLEAMLKAGNYIEVACRAAGVAPRTFRDWMVRGRSERPGDELYRELVGRIEQALAEGEVRNVAQIASAARENWQAAAWLLERGYPERWGRVSTRLRAPASVPPEEDASAPAAGHEPDPFAEVDELAARRRARTGD